MKSILQIVILLITFTSYTNISYAQFTKLLEFSGNDGQMPKGSFISDGTYLYGMTSKGGLGYGGTIFKIKPDGTDYDTLHNFYNNNENNQFLGSAPQGSLFSDGTFFYGMTNFGGNAMSSQGCGVIFKIKLDGTGYTKLLDFSGIINGCAPYGSFISDGTFLYGMTAWGGINNMGVIFKIKPDGTNFSKILDFDGTNGIFPESDLFFDGIFLYGMTRQGGASDMGLIFKIMPDGSGYENLHNFSGLNGKYPESSFISDGVFLYGVTTFGGINDDGIIFKIKTDGTDFSTLLDFNQPLSGVNPRGHLVSDGVYLYGTTFSGGALFGTVYKIKPDGTGYSNLNNFVMSNGGGLFGSLTLQGNYLYGMASGGGIPGYGTVFKINPYCVASTPSVSVSNTTLTVNSIADSYQWINCNIGNSSIPGQTNQNYNATLNGNYAIIISQNSCLDTSLCYTISDVGIIENSFSNSIKIFPNPFKQKTTFTFDEEQTNTTIKINDILGKQIKTLNFIGKEITLEKGDMECGIYFINIITERGCSTKKIIIND